MTAKVQPLTLTLTYPLQISKRKITFSYRLHKLLPCYYFYLCQGSYVFFGIN